MYIAQNYRGPRCPVGIRPRYNRPYRPTIVNPIRMANDVIWKSKWLLLISNIIAILIILRVVIIVSLEIAWLTLGTATYNGINIIIGPGLWCEIVLLIAGIFILMLNRMRRIHLWIAFALIVIIIGACFSIVLVGLNAKSINDWVKVFYIYDSLYRSFQLLPKFRIRSAQLAFFCVEFLLCIAFVIIYIVVSLNVSKIKRQRQAHIL